MSLFLGDSKLHITSSFNTKEDLRDNDYLPNTSFSSKELQVSPRFLERVTGEMGVYGSSGPPVMKYVLQQDTSDTLFAEANVLWFAIGISAYGLPVISRNGKPDYYRYIQDNRGEIFSGHELLPTGTLYATLGEEGSDYVPPSSVTWLDVYIVDVLEPPAGDILIGDGTIKIGDRNLLDHKYISFDRNFVDTFYDTDMDFSIQLLNSRGNVGNIGISNNSIVSIHDGVSVGLFGDGINSTAVATTGLVAANSVTSIDFTSLPLDSILMIKLIHTSRYSTLPDIAYSFYNIDTNKDVFMGKGLMFVNPVMRILNRIVTVHQVLWSSSTASYYISPAAEEFTAYYLTVS